MDIPLLPARPWQNGQPVLEVTLKVRKGTLTLNLNKKFLILYNFTENVGAHLQSCL